MFFLNIKIHPLSACGFAGRLNLKKASFDWDEQFRHKVKYTENKTDNNDLSQRVPNTTTRKKVVFFYSFEDNQREKRTRKKSEKRELPVRRDKTQIRNRFHRKQAN
ncbi:hypothetical protein M2137_001839 [Parabacteroides sp. PFB2-10]|nr:hypothetical protein [Parabacteroides sp. PFB2-10]MDL2208397.1 hypothetical protein [Parabacteroides sp. OttesenSCG-928-O15]